MQDNFAGDHEYEHPVEAMDAVDPMVLNSGRYLGLLLLLDDVPDVSHFGDEHLPLFDGHLASVGIQVAVQEPVIVGVRHDPAHNVRDLHRKLADVVVVETVLENYLLFRGQRPVKRNEQHPLLNKISHDVLLLLPIFSQVYYWEG